MTHPDKIRGMEQQEPFEQKIQVLKSKLIETITASVDRISEDSEGLGKNKDFIIRKMEGLIKDAEYDRLRGADEFEHF